MVSTSIRCCRHLTARPRRTSPQSPRSQHRKDVSIKGGALVGRNICRAVFPDPEQPFSDQLLNMVDAYFVKWPKLTSVDHSSEVSENEKDK